MANNALRSDTFPGQLFATLKLHLLVPLEVCCLLQFQNFLSFRLLDARDLLVGNTSTSCRP